MQRACLKLPVFDRAPARLGFCSWSARPRHSLRTSRLRRRNVPEKRQAHLPEDVPHGSYLASPRPAALQLFDELERFGVVVDDDAGRRPRKHIRGARGLAGFVDGEHVDVKVREGHREGLARAQHGDEGALGSQAPIDGDARVVGKSLQLAVRSKRKRRRSLDVTTRNDDDVSSARSEAIEQRHAVFVLGEQVRVRAFTRAASECAKHATGVVAEQSLSLDREQRECLCLSDDARHELSSRLHHEGIGSEEARA